MTIKLYINNHLEATATDITAAELREEAEVMCDELNSVASSGPLEVFRVDYVDADDPLRRIVIERDAKTPRYYMSYEEVATL